MTSMKNSFALQNLYTVNDSDDEDRSISLNHTSANIVKQTPFQRDSICPSDLMPKYSNSLTFRGNSFGLAEFKSDSSLSSNAIGNYQVRSILKERKESRFHPSNKSQNGNKTNNMKVTYAEVNKTRIFQEESYLTESSNSFDEYSEDYSY